MADFGPVEFKLNTPAVDFSKHVAHALALGLPEADDSQKRLTLIANGPSARNAPLDGVTMAVNGALGLFTERGLAPTYWIACDPQGPTPGLTTPADFLTEIPESTIYLVASKCHPAVFERLKGRDVRLWHVNDSPAPDKRRVPTAVSVTICAMMLAQRVGYRTIDVWGWDCSFEGERHHAALGDLSNTPQRIEIAVGEGDEAQRFTSNPTWCCEITDASKILPVLRWAGADVRIHGPGMIAAILPEFAASGL